MSIRTTILLGTIIFIVCFKSFAGLRCSSGQLLEVGDSAYKVYKCLGEPLYKTILHSPNGSGNEEIDYYTISGQDHKIHMIDGSVYSIDGDENIN